MRLPELLVRVSGYFDSHALAWCTQIASAHAMCTTHHLIREWGGF